MNRFYVHSSVKDEFSEKLREKVKKFRVGSGFDSSTTHGPLVNQKAVEKVRSHVEDAVSHGAKVLAGGHEKSSTPSAEGYFYPPTVLGGMKNNMKIAGEETFGPVAGIFEFNTEEEVLAAANNTRFGLSGYFFSRDISRCWRVAEKLEVGMVGVNTGVISSEVAPFGGVSIVSLCFGRPVYDLSLTRVQFILSHATHRSRSQELDERELDKDSTSTHSTSTST